MRYAALVISMFCLVQPADASTAPEIDPRASLQRRPAMDLQLPAKPDYAHVPAAVRVLFHAQSFKEPENSGIYLGFIAGAIGRTPPKRAAGHQLVSGAPGGRMGDRSRYRLFRAAGLAELAAQGRAANARTQGDDRQLPRRLAVDLDRHPAGKTPSPACSTSYAAYSPKILLPRTTRSCR